MIAARISFKRKQTAPCPDNCENWDEEDGECQKCEQNNGYALKNGLCENSCGVGHYKLTGGATHFCYPCPADNCIECDDNSGACTKCS